MKKEETKIIGVRCPIGVREKLQILADKDNRTLSNLIVKILSDYVQDKESE